MPGTVTFFSYFLPLTSQQGWEAGSVGLFISDMRQLGLGHVLPKNPWVLRDGVELRDRRLSLESTISTSLLRCLQQQKILENFEILRLDQQLLRYHIGSNFKSPRLKWVHIFVSVCESLSGKKNEGIKVS